MKILAVDDEPIQLKLLERSIRSAVPDCELSCFGNSSEAIAWAQENTPDVVFSDIQMPVMSGIEMAKQIKKIYPKTNIVFVTGYYEDYAVDAMSIHFSGYLSKPVNADAVAEEMQNLRYPLPKKPQNKKLRVQCFGNFEVYANGQPLHFERQKTKELLAYLVDRHGALVTVGEICATIFEDESNDANNKGYLRKCATDLKNALAEVGAGSVFAKGYNKYGIVASEIECDYYDWERGEAYAVRAFRGEYMLQYSWAEETLGNILNQ